MTLGRSNPWVWQEGTNYERPVWDHDGLFGFMSDGTKGLILGLRSTRTGGQVSPEDYRGLFRYLIVIVVDPTDTILFSEHPCPKGSVNKVCRQSLKQLPRSFPGREFRISDRRDFVWQDVPKEMFRWTRMGDVPRGWRETHYWRNWTELKSEVRTLSGGV